MTGGWLGTRSLASVLVLSILALPGCLEDTPAKKDESGGGLPAAGNVTESRAIPPGSIAVSNRVCTVNPASGQQQCFPGGMGVPGMGGGGGGTLAYSFPVNGSVQSANLTVKWSSSSPGPASAPSYEVVVTARAKGTSATNPCGGGFGGGGGGQAAPAKELVRKTGASPIVIQIPTLAWDTAHECMRVQILMTSRAPAPAFVGGSSGDTVTVTGDYVTVIPPPPAPTAGNTTKPAGN